MNWTQNYDPLGSWQLSTVLAALPVVTLFFVLVVVKRKVWESALAGFLMAVAIAMCVFDIPANLVAWLMDPPAIDPLTAMPATGISEAEARDVAAYLYTLR